MEIFYKFFKHMSTEQLEIIGEIILTVASWFGIHCFYKKKYKALEEKHEESKKEIESIKMKVAETNVNHKDLVIAYESSIEKMEEEFEYWKGIITNAK